MITKNLRYIVCTLIGLSFFGFDASATHVVGGELSYRHIGGDQYEVRLTFRRDCFNGSSDASFDNPANVWIFNAAGQIQDNLGVNGRLKMNFNPDDTLNTIVMSDCGFEGTQVCVHQTTYVETINLPYKPGEGGYILAYQRCCRNTTLENILAPLKTGGTWTVAITEEAQIQSNQSPEFGNSPLVYVCANEDLDFDFSANDADGDSLVYKLCTPLSGGSDSIPIPIFAPKPPYEEIIWNEAGGYSLENLLGGSSPLQIDPVTGFISGKPPTVGQFLVGICVEEYRDGIKIGEIRRDFQYNVRICSPPPTAIFEANDGDCLGPEVQFNNQSLSGSTYQWNFDFPSDDPDFQSTEESPFFTYPEEGVYDVQLIVIRGTDQCSDAIVQQVAALFSDIDVDYSLNILACNDDGGFTIRLINTSTETEEGFDIIGQEWTIFQGENSQSFLSPVVTTDIAGEDFILELQVESETGCKKTLIDTVDIDDFEFVADFEYVLDGCMEDGFASIAFGDVSDSLNLYDSPSGYLWTVNSVIGVSTFMDSSFVVNVSVNETITVTLDVDFGGECMASVTKMITLEDILPQTSYDLIEEGCPDDGTVDLTFASTSDTSSPDIATESNSWSITIAGETTTSTDDEFMINVPKDSLLEVTLITTFVNGCKDTISESYIPGPFSTIQFDATPFVLCLGDSSTFVTNPNSMFTYVWEPMEGLYFEDLTDLSNPQVIGISDTQYSVTVSDGLCSIESTVDIIVLDENNLSIEGDSITCDGSVSLTASGGIGEGDFVWSLTTDFADTLFIGNTLEASFEGQAETYYAAFTGESCNDPYAEFTVILSNIFDVVFNGDPVRVCLGDTVPLLANPDSTLTYVWSPLEGLYFPDPDDNSTAMVIGINDTNYDVTISDDFCILDTMVEVVIADSQNFQVLGDSIVCTDTVQLIGFGASGIGTYQWSLDEDFTTIIHEGDTLNTLLDDLSVTYFVQFTDNTCGELVLSYSVRKFVFDILTVEPYQICPGDTLTYVSANEGEGPVTIQWVDDPHVVADGDTYTPTIGVGIDEAEDFELVFIATSPTGCTYTDTISFEIIENPVVDFTYKLEECGNLTVCFFIDGDFNGFPSWDFGDPTTTDDVSLDAAPCYTYPTAGVYDVTLGNISSFCPFKDTVHTVTVNDEIMIDPIADQVICLNDTVNISASSSHEGVVYVWCNLQGDTIQLGPDYSEIVTEDYQVVLKGEDPNGCFDMDTIDIGPFVFDIVDDVPEIFCDSETTTIDLIVNGTTEGFTFEWGPSECIVSGGNTASPVLIADDSKEFMVTITNIELGCEIVETYSITTTSFTVDIQAEPDTVINQGDEVEISVVEPFDDYSYEWSDGTEGETLVDTPEESITYYVTVTDEMGCTATDSIFVRVRIPTCDENDIYLPTAFSPNGDNVNDILLVRSNFVESMELLVYNRWGEEVFRSKDQSVGWDGSYKGDMLSPDVYAFTLLVICINDEEYRTRGNVSLIK